MYILQNDYQKKVVNYMLLMWQSSCCNIYLYYVSNSHINPQGAMISTLWIKRQMVREAK